MCQIRSWEKTLSSRNSRKTGEGVVAKVLLYEVVMKDLRTDWTVLSLYFSNVSPVNEDIVPSLDVLVSSKDIIILICVKIYSRNCLILPSSSTATSLKEYSYLCLPWREYYCDLKFISFLLHHDLLETGRTDLSSVFKTSCSIGSSGCQAGQKGWPGKNAFHTQTSDQSQGCKSLE